MDATDMVDVLGSDGQAVRRSTWGEFASDNRCWMTEEEESEMERTLADGREYWDGGGASPAWGLRRVAGPAEGVHE